MTVLVPSNTYVKLEKQLLLLSWLNDGLGYGSNQELFEDLKQADEGFSVSGQSHLLLRLQSRSSSIRFSMDNLERYDRNIRNHLNSINAGRTQPIQLRYFQHLATLYTEIFLDSCRTGRRGGLLDSLNSHVSEHNTRKHSSEPHHEEFSDADLNTLAFWMATGSGKTLIMHLNYHQFMHYGVINPRTSLDNILLITPNEGLSEQHLDELQQSGIPAKLFDMADGGLAQHEKATIQIIEITKLTKNRKGSNGVSVPVERFEGNNLVFVDEGHKGSGGEAWRAVREELGRTGFTFEYSATFGQALAAAKKGSLTQQYGKSIVFDYSFRYFHGDGYGKDFRVLNLQQDTVEEETDLLLLGNLLSFYEQQRLFEDKMNEIRPYLLEKPLWAFVGSTVNAVYTERKKQRSDVMTITRFLHRVLLNERGWVTKKIRSLLSGNTRLTTESRQDIFHGKFPYLREANISPKECYSDILTRTFHAPARGRLHLCEIRGNKGEFGLKVSGADRYFGVIYIGDASKFKKVLEEDDSDITLEEDAISPSLFEHINNQTSEINILIGAKKFMEGWNSWRVSNMGLLNIGRQEGSEIIQLFGRGIRLRGQNLSLKRSTVLPGKAPKHVNLLETLNIFAIRANYMANFRDYLEREGVEVDEPIEIKVPIKVNQTFMKRKLAIPQITKDLNFTDEIDLLLDEGESKNCDSKVHVDLSSRIQILESGGEITEARSKNSVTLPAKSLDMVDWEKAYLDLLEYKEQEGLDNLAIPSPEALKEIIAGIGRTAPPYDLIAAPSTVEPESIADLESLQEATACILRAYATNFYKEQRRRWTSRHLKYQTLNRNHPNLSFNFEDSGTPEQGGSHEYVVSVSKQEEGLIEHIENLIRQADRLYEEDEEYMLDRIHFDRHIYQPLLIENAGIAKISPPAMNKKETQFVCDLREYWKREKDETLTESEIFLLRNQSRGKGVGFFENHGFYPDFILWHVAGSHQHIVFIEPHGMIHAKSYQNDDKVRLHERLPEIEKELARKSRRRGITLDSFILSATAYDDLKPRYEDGTWTREDFAKHHILFFSEQENLDHIAQILKLPSRHKN